jgi:hypothetical protein
MGKTFRPYEPRPVHLRTASPHDWLPEDHLAYFLLDVVEELDPEHFTPMLDRVALTCRRTPRRVSADSGCFSEHDVADAQQRDIDVYIATGRTKHREPATAPRGRPASLTVRQRMARKLATRRGAAVDARRKAMVEPVFGQIKQARGLRSLLRRGIPKARAEWALICIGHNLLKLHTARRAA